MHLSTRVDLFARMAWAILVVFGMVGVLMGAELAFMVLTLSAVMWATIRILVEGLVSYKLYMTFRHSQEEGAGETDGGKEE